MNIPTLGGSPLEMHPRVPERILLGIETGFLDAKTVSNMSYGLSLRGSWAEGREVPRQSLLHFTTDGSNLNNTELITLYTLLSDKNIFNLSFL